MKNILTTGAALMLTTTVATAGGIDRNGNPFSVLFEDGNYVELSFSKVTPDISGDYAAPLSAFGPSTENMANDFTSVGVAFKYAVNDQIDVGLFLNQPYGADAEYTAGAYTGLEAEWKSSQIAVVLKYQINENVSVYGGARSVESEATIQIPLSATAVYNAEAAADRQTGYIAGVAYERPDIALRVALTYESGVSHEFATTELVNGAPITPGTTTTIEIPQAVTLDFQTGVAADTLVFGSIRWSEWSVWEVRPAGYETLTGGDRVTGIDSDVTTYRIGVGRRLNDNLSVFGRVTYEDASGDVASRLAPTDGSTAIGIGGTYTMDNVKLTGGVEYVMLGDATDGSGTAFTDNSALGVGLSVGFSF
ncbi:OmpP1/FadL family transporter [Yoonia sp. R2331]|uniref:OmpP1/FadL family transporter n=1 Tax=Yoonia sp. R2331 TaxID=3237238 RepID=UPI0034E53F3A